MDKIWNGNCGLAEEEIIWGDELLRNSKLISRK